MTLEYPSSIARFYDTIYHRVRDSVDIDYFLDEIKKAHGAVLEAGAGTGRLFTTALGRGEDIWAIDISPSMLSILLDKLPEDQKHRVSRQNIVDFSLDRKFTLVLAPFRVMMHLADKEDQLRAINNVYEHLEPGGRFIFDVFIPDIKQLVSGLRDVTDFEGEYEPGRKVKRTVNTRPDLLNQVINVSFHMEWDSDDGIESDDWTFRMRYFFRYELEHLVERSSFRDYKIYGDYKLSDLDENSKEFVVVCTK